MSSICKCGVCQAVKHAGIPPLQYQTIDILIELGLARFLKVAHDARADFEFTGVLPVSEAVAAALAYQRIKEIG